MGLTLGPVPVRVEASVKAGICDLVGPRGVPRLVGQGRV